MKIISSLKKIVLCAFLVSSFTACEEDDKPTPIVDNTIAGIASRNPNLSTLVAALSRAGLVETLKGAGPFTVFAPTNDAFSAFLVANKFKDLEAVPPALLKEVLLNHVVSGNVASTALVDKSYIKTLATYQVNATTTNALSMFVNKSNGVRLNGVSTVSSADIAATNGVVHVVDAVIGLPTIVTHAAANPAFSRLASLVTSPAQAGVKDALEGAGPLTVFAPTDAAFIAFNTELTTPANPQGLAGVSAANVTKVLQYHVLSGNNLAASLTAGAKTTALGQSFTLALTPTVTISDISKRVSDVTPADVQCSNGVIHILSRVLLPSL